MADYSTFNPVGVEWDTARLRTGFPPPPQPSQAVAVAPPPGIDLSKLLGNRGNLEDDVRLASVLAPLGGEERKLKEQYAYAKKLRDENGLPGGTTVGRTYRADSKLSVGGALANKYLGAKYAEESSKGLEGIPNKLVAELKKMLEERQGAAELGVTRQRDAEKEQQMMAEAARLRELEERQAATVGGGSEFTMPAEYSYYDSGFF